MLATVSLLVGFVAGLMYLVQVRRLKHKSAVAAGRLRLPSLEWLQWANGRAMLVSLLMLGLGVLSGMVLNLINIRDRPQPLAVERSGGVEHMADVLLAAGGGGGLRIVSSCPTGPQSGLFHAGQLSCCCSCWPPGC